MIDSILPGSIIIAFVYDESGRNPKERPLVLVTLPPKMEPVSCCACVAITSTWESVPLTVRVMLPYQSDRKLRSSTGLRIPSAAHCEWLVSVPVEKIISVKGRCPKLAFDQILTRLANTIPPTSSDSEDTDEV